MKHLIIRNFGPIDNVDVEFGKVNVIIGMQSSGKSCVLKTACFCSWVEKRLEITQRANGFGDGSAFIDLLASYYNMTGFLKDNSYIEYETGKVKFSYNHAEQSFKMAWKSQRWNYKRHKVSYVPADRNIVAAIPSWSGLEIDKNMLDFMSDWDKARKYTKSEDNFLNLGMKYSYDAQSGKDTIKLSNGDELTLKESSSGIQSLLPMFVHLDYLTNGQYNDSQSKFSFERNSERKNLYSNIYRHLCKDSEGINASVTIDGFDYYFKDNEQANRFKAICNAYTYTDHSEIFIEEPEDNLFPPTQCQLVNWILEITDVHNDDLFIATHSPYILNQMIKNQPKDLQVFFTYKTTDGVYSLRKLDKQEVREIYDCGVDLFLNFESYV